MKSMHPLAIALPGMSGCPAVSGFCAMVMPPLFLYRTVLLLRPHRSQIVRPQEPSKFPDEFTAIMQGPQVDFARRKGTQARWRANNPDYAAGYGLQQRNAQQQPPEPLRVPPPLDQLPWDLAKDQVGAQGADFLGLMSSLLARTAKDQIRPYLIDLTRVAAALPRPAEKTRSRPPRLPSSLKEIPPVKRNFRRADEIRNELNNAGIALLVRRPVVLRRISRAKRRSLMRP